MKKTKIEYCTHTWNPVSGCWHNCRHCNTVSVVQQTGESRTGDMTKLGSLHILDEPFYRPDGLACTYPFGFDPTFFRYRLSEYKDAAPANILVSDAGDLFGNWIPNAWIEDVFRAALAAPQHNYLFLTRTPKRYRKLPLSITQQHCPQNMFFGASITTRNDILSLVMTLQEYPRSPLNFLSIDPICENIDLPEFLYYHPDRLKWVIVGTKISNGKDKVYPDRKWIEEIMVSCYKRNIPLFMKSDEESYMPYIMSSEFVQEYPFQLMQNIKNMKRG